jgi:riboflavin synthase
LTVVNVGNDWFTVALIEYTREHVALLDGGVGARVNLEVDIIAKYVERLLFSRDTPTASSAGDGVTLEKLQSAGFA